MAGDDLAKLAEFTIEVPPEEDEMDERKKQDSATLGTNLPKDEEEVGLVQKNKNQHLGLEKNLNEKLIDDS